MVYPVGVSCCDLGSANGDSRCPDSPDVWDEATWSALHFAIFDNHYFQYKFDSAGSNNSAQFTAHAQADLDCDGTFNETE